MMSSETQTTAVAVREDNGKPALYNPAAFDQIWRASKLFASSDLVPSAYRNKPENCFIAIEMADRMGISPFAMLQSLVVIQGKPSMEAKLVIALINDSGIFTDPLEFEVIGDDPHAKNFKVRAFATMRRTGKVCHGPWITYQMVEGEGWLQKQGSKWKTMPDLMFRYRAASYFAKLYTPNITMGMQTREEVEDIRTVDITPQKQATPTTPVLAEPTPATVIEANEVVDVETQEQKATRTRRTKAQIEAERQAATAPPQPPADPEPEEAPPIAEPVDDDAEWPDPPTPPDPVPDKPDEDMGDLF